MTNKSADTNANNGSRGKLNSEQLEERTLLHAKHKVTGHPTKKWIVEHWFTDYGIKMTVQSENEWCRNNQERIDTLANELIESGNIEVSLIDNNTICSQLNITARHYSDSIRNNKNHCATFIKSMKDINDPYKLMECTKDEYESANEHDIKRYDNKLKLALTLNTAIVGNFNAISKVSVDQGKLLVDHMKLVYEINKGSQSIDAEVQNKVNDKIKDMGLKIQAEKDASHFDPLEAVTDEQRGETN